MATPKYPGDPLQIASQGEAVAQVQRKLGGLKVDRIFGPKTRDAVRKFQREHGLDVDGIVGPKTWAALFGKPAPAKPAKAGKVAMPVKTDMARNTNGWTGPNGHDGIDLICAANAPIYAMVKSRVVRVSPDGWWGNNPVASHGHPISDGDGIIVLEALEDAGPIKKGLHFGYGHAEKATVKVGDVVKAGQQIGHAGFARAWHVHFMVNNDPPVNGLYRGVGDRDPRPFLDYAKGHE